MLGTRAVIVLGLLVSSAETALAQGPRATRLPPPLRYSIEASNTEETPIPPAATGPTYAIEGAVLGAIVGGIGGFLLFRKSENQQCPGPCRQDTNPAALTAVLGAAVGGVLGGYIGSKIEQPIVDPENTHPRGR